MKSNTAHFLRLMAMIGCARLGFTKLVNTTGLYSPSWWISPLALHKTLQNTANSIFTKLVNIPLSLRKTWYIHQLGEDNRFIFTKLVNIPPLPFINRVKHSKFYLHQLGGFPGALGKGMRKTQWPQSGSPRSDYVHVSGSSRCVCVCVRHRFFAVAILAWKLEI